MPSLIEIRPHQ